MVYLCQRDSLHWDDAYGSAYATERVHRFKVEPVNYPVKDSQNTAYMAQDTQSVQPRVRIQLPSKDLDLNTLAGEEQDTFPFLAHSSGLVCRIPLHATFLTISI